MVTKKFQLLKKEIQMSSNGEGVSNGDRKIWLHPTNHHCHMVTKYFLIISKKGHHKEG
jgi:hypothetical protein